MEMVQTNNLVYIYQSYQADNPDAQLSFTALKSVNITIKKGEFVAVLGHNGSGKSTLAKHFNALLTPGEGEVFINGMNTKTEEDIWKIRQTAGMVFQNPDNQIIATTVEEDVAFGPENLGIPPEEIRARVDRCLGALGMEEYANQSPHFLSGGQKQRVAIAGVLAMEPACIVLDEPTAMLDPIGRREVIKSVMKLNREKGITVVLITHYMDEAVLADRVVVMEEGQVVMEGTPRAVFSHVEELKGIGLDVPQVTEIAQRLIKKGVTIPGDILTIDEMVGALCQYKSKI